MLSQIIAILYPVMKEYSELVAPVLDYLIVDNRLDNLYTIWYVSSIENLHNLLRFCYRSQLRGFFREISFIPDAPHLLKANNVLKEELENDSRFTMDNYVYIAQS